MREQFANRPTDCGHLTDYGFEWGPAEVIRASSDPKRGVWLIVRGKKQEITIRVTRSGLLRVGGVEAAPQ